MKGISFKWVINCITIDCHNTSKQLSYIKDNLNLNFSQSENFILFSPVLFHLPSWIIVQSDGCFSICHIEFLSNHRPSCHLELLSNQRQAAPQPPHGIELPLLHYYSLYFCQFFCKKGKFPFAYFGSTNRWVIAINKKIPDMCSSLLWVLCIINTDFLISPLLIVNLCLTQKTQSHQFLILNTLHR